MRRHSVIDHLGRRLIRPECPGYKENRGGFAFSLAAMAYPIPIERPTGKRTPESKPARLLAA